MADFTASAGAVISLIVGLTVAAFIVAMIYYIGAQGGINVSGTGLDKLGTAVGIIGLAGVIYIFWPAIESFVGTRK